MSLDDKPTLAQKLEGWRAAAARERECQQSEPMKSPAELLDEASELADLFGALLETEDATRLREVEEARRLWAKLRQSMIGRRDLNSP